MTAKKTAVQRAILMRFRRQKDHNGQQRMHIWVDGKKFVRMIKGGGSFVLLWPEQKLSLGIITDQHPTRCQQQGISSYSKQAIPKIGESNQ